VTKCRCKNRPSTTPVGFCFRRSVASVEVHPRLFKPLSRMRL
jgi:hypothetical protein